MKPKEDREYNNNNVAINKFIVLLWVRHLWYFSLLCTHTYTLVYGGRAGAEEEFFYNKTFMKQQEQK